MRAQEYGTMWQCEVCRRCTMSWADAELCCRKGYHDETQYEAFIEGDTVIIKKESAIKRRYRGKQAEVIKWHGLTGAYTISLVEDPTVALVVLPNEIRKVNNESN